MTSQLSIQFLVASCNTFHCSRYERFSCQHVFSTTKRNMISSSTRNGICFRGISVARFYGVHHDQYFLPSHVFIITLLYSPEMLYMFFHFQVRSPPLSFMLSLLLSTIFILSDESPEPITRCEALFCYLYFSTRSKVPAKLLTKAIALCKTRDSPSV